MSLASEVSVKETEVELGYLEDVDAEVRPAVEYLDASQWDGGKIGGLPVWLHVADGALPRTDSHLTCKRCSTPLAMLTQLYAPVEKAVVGHDEAYHRMLYVFVCLTPGCLNRASDAADAADAPSVVVLRSQARKGQESVSLQSCAVCGLPSTSRCSRCRGVRYCSRAHQALHWKAGGHKDACAGDGKACGYTAPEGYLQLPPLLPCAVEGRCVVPEFEVMVEPEPDAATREAREIASLPANAASALVAAKAAHASAGSAAAVGASAGGASTAAKATAAVGEEEAEEEGDLSIADLTQSKLAQWTGSHLVQDRVLQFFQRRIAAEPTQVIRYCRWPAQPPAAAAAADAPALAASEPISSGAGAASAPADAPAEAAEADDDDEEDGADLTPAPLWMTSKHRPLAASVAAGATTDDAIAAPATRCASSSSGSGAVPPCAHCGSPRGFEFQIMPQLIAQLGSCPAAAALDFGALAIYTCTASCGAAARATKVHAAAGSVDAAPAIGSATAHTSQVDGLGQYCLEFAWVQPTEDDTEAQELRQRMLKTLATHAEEAEEKDDAPATS